MSEKIGLFLFCAPASELGAGDGSGNGHVETLGTVSLMKIGDEQAMVDTLADCLRDAVAFVAHDDDAMLGEGLLIDIIAIEQRTINGIVLWQCIKKLQQVGIYNMYMRKTSHSGLYYLGVVGISGILAAIDGVNTEPVGYANDGTEVAGILHTVESQIEVRGKRYVRGWGRGRGLAGESGGN